MYSPGKPNALFTFISNPDIGTTKKCGKFKLKTYAILVLFSLVYFCFHFCYDNSFYSSSNSNLPIHLQAMVFNSTLTTLHKGLTNPIEFCQNTSDRFILFHDVSSRGSGLNHKVSDFYHACILAIKTNRILVDFPALLTPKHNRDIEGHERNGKEKTSNSTGAARQWYFSNFLDLHNWQFFATIQDQWSNCKLKFIYQHEFESRSPESTLSIEFGRFMENPKDNNISNAQINLVKLQLLKTQSEKTIKVGMGKTPYAKFIRHAAVQLKASCLEKVKSLSNETIPETPWFYVIHLRATDKNCVKLIHTPDTLLQKLRKDFGKLYQYYSIVYLMTDLPVEDKYVKVIEKSLGSRFCHAPDIPLFKKNPFREDNYLVYLVESEALYKSDGYLKTYGSGKNYNSNNMGVIVPMKCTLEEMKQL